MRVNRTARSPVALQDSVRLSYVTGTFAGARAQFDSARLVNVYRVPIEVLAVRFMTVPLPSETITGSLILSDFVRIEAKLAQFYLTDGAVPISILAPYRVWEQDAELAGPAGDEYPRVADFSQVSMRTVFLPRPLFLLPGAGFNVVASIPNDELTASYPTNFDVDVYISIIGRFLAPSDRVPEMHEVPIVSFVQLTQGTKRLSLETDLRNPLAKTIHVRRFVGARPRARVGVAEQLDDGYSNFTPVVPYTPTLLDVRFPDGSAMSEVPIPFDEVFGQLRTWPADFHLDPNKRIRAAIIRNTAEPDRMGYQIGLFATRQEMVR